MLLQEETSSKLALFILDSSITKLFLLCFSDEHSPEKYTSVEIERRRSRLNSPAEDEEEMLNSFPSDPDYGKSKYEKG